MKFTILPLAVAATAFVLPDPEVFNEPEFRILTKGDTSQSARDKVLADWWDAVPSKESVLSAAADTYDWVSHGVHDAVDGARNKLEQVIEEEIHLHDDESPASSQDEDSFLGENDEIFGGGGRGRKGRHGRKGRKPKKPTKSIFELVAESPYTKTLAKLVSEYDDLVQALNSTGSAGLTVFAPTDEAFKRIPRRKGDKKPSKEAIKKFLQYHVVPGFYPARRVLYQHTLGTALKEPLLGDNNQRVRVRVGFGGVRVNFFSKVVYANAFATNGVIHAIDHVLVPPPYIGKIVSLVPQQFSTLLLAFDKTDLYTFLHDQTIIGTTFFAPSNAAFRRLGPRANAFLFNTEKGAKYLKAILKYHVVANGTLYSDHYSSGGGGGKKEVETQAGRYHADLPTLLGDRSIAIDVVRYGAFIRVRVNGFVPVVAQDVLAKNGVIHVVPRVLIPSYRGGKGKTEEVDGEISVEELKERLREYVDEEERDSSFPGDL